MHSPLLSILLLFLAALKAHCLARSAGCSQTADFGSAVGGPARRFAVEHPSHDAHDRYAYLHIPESYDKNAPAPLILAFHGKKQDIAAFEAATRLSDEEVNGEYIVVYPEGVDGMWTSDPEAPFREERNDIAFTEALLDYLITTAPLCIDLSRIYAVGFSNGGGLAGVLACDHFLSNRFAAFATASGAFYRPESLKESGLAWCNAARSPIPFMTFHGDADPVIDYEGVGTPDGATFEVPKWMTGKALRAGCDGKKGNRTTKIAGGLAEKVKWYCPKGVGDEAIVHYKMKGVGHMWPRKSEAGEGENSKVPAPIDATRIVLKWFANHRIPDEFLTASRPSGGASGSMVYEETPSRLKDEL